jgi:hypothetical protein
MYWQQQVVNIFSSSRSGSDARKKLETTLSTTFAAGFGCEHIDLEDWAFASVDWRKVARFVISRTSAKLKPIL